MLNAPATILHLLADNATPPLLRAYAAFTYALHAAREDLSSLITAEHLARQVNPRELSKLILDGIDQRSEFITWGNACWLMRVTVLRFLVRE